MKEIKGLKSIRDSFRTRQVKYGGYAALITLAVIVGILLLNLIVGQFSPQIDMTEGGLYSLQDQTLQIVDEIESPVNLYGLWQPGTENQQLVEVINLYLARNRNIHFEVRDPNKNPQLTAQFDKTNQGLALGSLVVQGEKGFKVIAPADMYDYMTNPQSGQRSVAGLGMERQITAALLFVATGQTPVIYEIMGHQEYSLTDLGIAELIQRENYTLQQINLTQSNIPEDASALILNAPRMDITQDEADKILTYLEKGGRFLVMADSQTGALPMLNQVMESYGMRFDFGFLNEINTNYMAGSPFGEIPDLLEHDITAPLTQSNLVVFLPYSMGISELAAKRRTVELMPFMVSSPEAYIRTDMQDTSTTRIDSDIAGPVTIGMTATDPSWLDPNNPPPQARIVAIANANLLPAGASGQAPANIDLFMNSVTWLEDRPESLTVRTDSIFLLPMRITETLKRLFGVIIVGIIPLGFFIAGFIIWLRRRHL